HKHSLEKAFNGARKFAEKPTGWIAFIGSFGCGKTHLASAIANFRFDLGFSPLFIVVPDLLDHLRATFNPKSIIRYDKLFEGVKKSELLILDDLGTQSATPWAREKLYQLFNYRYQAKLPTVITSVDYMIDIDPRIRSRMMDTRLCTNFAITAPLYTKKKNR
ncbi:MAG: ATP-binding protein, partial [Anaerolineales bacterium]